MGNDDAPWSPRPLRVGVTGHRDLGDVPGVDDHVRERCRQILAPLAQVGRLNGAGVEAFSALAAGADTRFAEAALDLDIPLIGIVPFSDYPRDFEGAERLAFEALLGRCARTIRLERKRRTDRAYLEGGTTLVRSVDLLVAIWNGRPARGPGGTGDVVDYAERRGLPVVRLDPAGAGSSPK